MNNQWGRVPQAGASSGGSGLAGILVAIVASLVIGTAGGYFYQRLSTGDQTASAAAARQRIATLEAQVAEQTRRTGEAEKSLDAVRAAQPSDNADVPALNDRIASLRAELDTMTETLAAASQRQQLAQDEAASTSRRLEGERDALQARLETLTAQSAAAERARAGLEAQLSALRKSADTAQAGDSAAVAALKTQIADLNARQTALARDLETARSEAQKNARELATSQSAVAVLQQKLSGETRKVVELETQLAAARDEIGRAAMNATTTAVAPQAAVPAAKTPEAVAAPSAAPVETAAAPRDAAAIDAALARTPGLGSLSQGDGQRLRALLISGACVTTALETVFERVPVIALRNLMRDLGSGC